MEDSNVSSTDAPLSGESASPQKLILIVPGTRDDIPFWEQRVKSSATSGDFSLFEVRVIDDTGATIRRTGSAFPIGYIAIIVAANTIVDSLINSKAGQPMPEWQHRCAVRARHL